MSDSFQLAIPYQQKSWSFLYCRTSSKLPRFDDRPNLIAYSYSTPQITLETIYYIFLSLTAWTWRYFKRKFCCANQRIVIWFYHGTNVQYIVSSIIWGVEFEYAVKSDLNWKLKLFQNGRRYQVALNFFCKRDTEYKWYCLSSPWKVLCFELLVKSLS